MKLTPKRGGFKGQFRVGSIARPRVIIMAPNETVAQERAIRMQAAISLLVRAKLTKQALEVLPLLAAARTQRDFAGVESAMRTEAAQAPEQAPAVGPVTFRDVNELWLSGVLYMQHKEPVKFKSPSSVNNTRGLMNIILPILGDKPLAAITRADCDKVKHKINQMDIELGQRRKYCRAVRQVLGYAVEPLRIIDVVPVPAAWVPSGKEKRKAFQMIYPREDSTLMGCGEVPIEVRFYVGLILRTGMRPSEGAQLQYRDVSESIGKLNLDDTKTNCPRAFFLEDDVLAAFAALKPASAQPDDYVFPFVRANIKRVVQDVLHPALKAAGLDVQRPELFINSDNRRHITMHDGRATYVTLKAALGANEDEIMRVTGHSTSKEIRTYKREIGELAEQVRRGKLEWFEPLDLLLGLRAEPSQSAGGVAQGVARVIEIHGKKRNSRSPARTSEGSFPQSETSNSREKRPSNSRNQGAVPPETGGVAQAGGANAAGLTAAIASAAAAGKWTLVERLTTQLELVTAQLDAAQG